MYFLGTSVFLFLNVLIYLLIFDLFSAGLGFCCCTRTFPVCGEQGLLSGCPAGASHCRGPCCRRAQALRSTGVTSATHGPVAVMHRLGCSQACGIFLDQGSNPMFGGFLTTVSPGKSGNCYISITYALLIFLSVHTGPPHFS